MLTNFLNKRELSDKQLYQNSSFKSWFTKMEKKTVVSLGLVWVCTLILMETATQAEPFKNGFDLEKVTMPVNLIRAGGPPKDGIPAIDHPKFDSVESATWLSKTERVLGIEINGESKAYPVSILNWHELVNDSIYDRDIVVTFCPLCGTGMVFDAVVGGEKLNFGVSGLLFESDVLLYDRETMSLWSQIWMKGVSGSYTEQNLEPLVVEHTSWEAWAEEHPNTQVLNRDTGYKRDYSRNPYAGYEVSSRTYFPVQNNNDSFHPKSWVAGVRRNGITRAYLFDKIKEKPVFTDNFAGEVLNFEFDVENQSLKVWQGDQRIPFVQAYWFAWYAFYPETEIY